jgi:hypothetical protein
MIAQAKNTNTLIHTSAVHRSTLNSERKFFYQKSLQDLTPNCFRPAVLPDNI